MRKLLNSFLDRKPRSSEIIVVVVLKKDFSRQSKAKLDAPDHRFEINVSEPCPKRSKIQAKNHSNRLKSIGFS
jgi:hypothetical protein